MLYKISKFLLNVISVTKLASFTQSHRTTVKSVGDSV